MTVNKTKSKQVSMIKHNYLCNGIEYLTLSLYCIILLKTNFRYILVYHLPKNHNIYQQYNDDKQHQFFIV